MVKPEILYEDRDLVVVKKPAGTDSQESRGSGQDMVSILKNYRISTELSTQGGGKAALPYIAVVHRLDRQVSGVMVYAKTKAAAAHLSKQVQDGRME
ncbi:MAG: RluA family pseudouridine synthase, partial [Clostridium sp.]|nr:RluA family pseudouridine synthase [Clostridium sp.]